ncbi:MAG: hypothetical protein FJ403_13000 [Verrucomicrobia bacterium]|nr:hypothetical protein [Verrucomicrobiota bacterium]
MGRRFHSVAAGQQRFNPAGKVAFMLAYVFEDILYDAEADALLQLRLLPFEDDLLIAQRANSQPGQNQAWAKDSQRENQSHFSHSR